MKKLMIKITTSACILLLSITLNAQTDLPTVPDAKLKKNILTYDITNSLNYAPINLSYQRVVSSRVAFTTAIGLFSTSENDNLETGTTKHRDYGSSGWLLLDLIIPNTNPKPFTREYNQKGNYFSIGVRLYRKNSSASSFYFEPEISVYNYKADLHKATVHSYYESFDKYINQTKTVKELSRRYTLKKMNFGYQFLADNGLVIDLSSGLGVTKNGTWASKEQFGSTSIVKHVAFDAELKIGYAF